METQAFWSGKKAKIAIIVAGLSIGLPSIFFYGGFAERMRASERFDEIDRQRPAAMVVSSDGRTVKVSEKEQVNSFFDIIRDSGMVSPHHSHSVKEKEVVVFISDYGCSYVLASDSENPDEYWLFLKSDTKSPGVTRVELRQFHSKRMTDWISSVGLSKIAPPA